LDDDAELLGEMPRGLPDLYFFRHLKSIGDARAGSQFGQRYLWKWWKRACKNLGVEGVDLYGGTRHSTVTALGDQLTPENRSRPVQCTLQIRLLRGISKALPETQKRFTQAAQNQQQTDRQKPHQKPGKILKIIDKDGSGES
jgi:hypothetical protein